MRQGKSPTEATTLALERIARYYPNFSGGLVAVNKEGQYGKLIEIESRAKTQFNLILYSHYTELNKI